MENKYRINTWDPKGSRPMHEVIVDLIGELNEGLKTPLMKEVKSYEEVRRILDNPEGVRIKELQIIDAWSVGKESRRELRDVLDEAYVFLSTEATQLIADRNEIAERNPAGVDEAGNINIGNENRKLKSTIISQYEVIEKLVEDYEKKGELSQKERNLLVYIRKVYSKALKETIKNLFSAASESTERVKIFPRDEQKAITNKVNGLQKKIRSLTRESKQKQKDQRKEEHEKLELEKKELEEKSTFLNRLKNTLNSSFPNLIDNENRVNVVVQKRMVGDLSKLKEIQQQLAASIEEIDTKTSQGSNWLQTRACLNETRARLEKIVAELTNSLNQQLEEVEESSSQSIQANDRILMERDIAEEFAKKRLEGKTLQVIFTNSLRGSNASTRWNKDRSGFEIKINIRGRQDKIQIFRTLAHELAHAVIFLREWKDEQQPLNKEDILYARQSHSKSFWEVFLDRDNISKESDISTLEFVKSKLSLEDQKKLDDFIKVENEGGENKIARWVYSPELNVNLEGRIRRKKILKVKDQTEAKAEWDKVRRNVLQWANESMNNPANEAKSKWESLKKHLDEETRWVQIEVWQKKENEQSSDQGKYKIYVFHNEDKIIPADLKNKLDAGLINDEKGDWEETERIDKDKVERLKSRKFPILCDETNQIQTQILQLPLKKIV